MQPIAWKRVISTKNDEKNDTKSEEKKEMQDFDEDEEGVEPFTSEGQAYVEGLEQAATAFFDAMKQKIWSGGKIEE